MPSNVELLPGEPILVLSLGEDYDYRTDMTRDLEQVQSSLDQQSQPIFFIIDASRMSLSLDDMMGAASGMVSLRTDLFKDPKIRESLLITQSRMIDLAARGLSSPIFGGIKLRVFNTLDEALAYARSNASMRDAV